MNKRPVIGVTGPVRGGAPAWYMTWLALKRAGAAPVRITAEHNPDMYQFDGLVLGGGSDIDPKNYGEELLIIKDTPEPDLTNKLWGALLFLVRVIFSVKTAQARKDTARDDMEKKLAIYAIEHRVPLLGICRGAQMINITSGGTLHQNSRMFYTETPRIRTILPRKRIYLTENSRLRKILNTDTCLVNSLHDQAVNKSGADIVVTAADKNGIIQAIEHTRHPFMIGVQWHPEYMPHIKIQQRLFNALVKTSENCHSSKDAERLEIGKAGAKKPLCK